jgi:hypothetical protein
MATTSETLLVVAARHAARVRRPFGRCRETSLRLAEDLARRGVPVRVLRCSDGRMDAPQADRRWLALRNAPRSWVHYVVQVEDTVVDLTRRQFFPDSGHPHLSTSAELASEWLTIEPVDLLTNRGPCA